MAEPHSEPEPNESRWTRYEWVLAEYMQRVDSGQPVDEDQFRSEHPEFADDFGRFLADKPVRAKRPTVADRVAKWSRRHEALVGLGAAALVLQTIVSAVRFRFRDGTLTRTSNVCPRLRFGLPSAHEVALSK